MCAYGIHCGQRFAWVISFLPHDAEGGIIFSSIEGWNKDSARALGNTSVGSVFRDGTVMKGLADTLLGRQLLAGAMSCGMCAWGLSTPGGRPRAHPLTALIMVELSCILDLILKAQLCLL